MKRLVMFLSLGLVFSIFSCNRNTTPSGKPEDLIIQAVCKGDYKTFKEFADIVNRHVHRRATNILKEQYPALYSRYMQEVEEIEIQQQDA